MELEEIINSKGAIAVAISALISALIWGFKIVVPRWIAAYEKANDAKIEQSKQHMEASIAAQKMTAEAVTGFSIRVPEAIKALELVHLGSEKRITERIAQAEDRNAKETQAAKEKVLDEISERRYIQMVEKMRGSQPLIPGGRHDL